MRTVRVFGSAFALTTVTLLASAGSARAEDPPAFTPWGEPLVQMPNCPFDPRAPHAMRCLSSSLVPKSVADARLSVFTNPPDAGAGVDASSAIGTCNGKSGGGGGGKNPTGLTPANLASLYTIPAAPTGAGKVVAIVDACSLPSVATDLAAYRSKFGLPALPLCGGAIGHAPTPGGAACFGVVSQRGDATIGPPDNGWGGEIALDVDMVSAACPDCSILLVEADSPNSWDLGPAVNQAVALGASAVSNSYGAPEDPNDQFGPAYSDGPYVVDYQHPGVLIAVASGDGLYDNQTFQGTPAALAPSFPSTVPSVLSVGGTTVKTGGSAARGGYTEVVWASVGGGTTSGCSGEFTKPAYQGAINMGSCNARANADVSAAAANIAVYAGGGWGAFAGTSCSSPFVAALLTRVGLADRDNAFIYAHGSAFYDVTSGNNDPSGKCHDVICNAGTGWDGPTGWGSPNGTALATLADSDAGTTPVDAGGADSGGADAGGTDAGGADGGPVDAGADAGHADAGGADAGHADAGSGHDSGSTQDATAGTDSGSGTDATAPGNDSGGVTGHDGGNPVADASGDGGDAATGGSNGCGCTTAGASSQESWALTLLGAVGIAAGLRRRSKRTQQR